MQDLSEIGDPDGGQSGVTEHGCMNVIGPQLTNARKAGVIGYIVLVSGGYVGGQAARCRRLAKVAQLALHCPLLKQTALCDQHHLSCTKDHPSTVAVARSDISENEGLRW